MEVTVLSVPGCPNVAVLDSRLEQALGRRGYARVTHRIVGDLGVAGAEGMHGSPTLLIDGVDPFATPDQPASISCRLYRGAGGRVEGSPSVGELRKVLALAADRQQMRMERRE